MGVRIGSVRGLRFWTTLERDGKGRRRTGEGENGKSDKDEAHFSSCFEGEAAVESGVGEWRGGGLRRKVDALRERC